MTRRHTLAYTVAIAAVLLAMIAVARASTSEHRDVWIVVGCFRDPITRGCVELTGPITSRTECRIVAERVAVLASGVRVSCQHFQEENRR